MGLSKARFDLLIGSSQPFHCLHCQFSSTSSDISALNALIRSDLKALRDEVATLTAKLQAAVSTNEPSDVNNAVSLSSPHLENISAHLFSSQPSPTHQSSRSETHLSHSHKERKFNVVFSGLAECPQGTPRSVRFLQDLSKIEKVLSDINISNSCHHIRDCFRLGKYNSDRSRPRPLLVTFSRVSDVQALLSKRGDLSSPLAVKPDLTKKNRLKSLRTQPILSPLLQTQLPHLRFLVRMQRGLYLTPVTLLLVNLMID